MPAAVLTFSFSEAPVLSPITVSYRGEGGAPRVELTGAQTYTVDLAMLPAEGCKGLLVTIDRLNAAGVAATAPVTVTWTSNSVSKSEELSPGGAFMIASPSPTHGITALSIVSTADAVAHVHAVG